jgi:hypothetical protein
MSREVQLNPAFANDYPQLATGRWYTAAAIAGLVKATRIVREGPRVQFTDRVLPSSHFQFRGEGLRWGASSQVRSRHIDRHAPPGGVASRQS